MISRKLETKNINYNKAKLIQNGIQIHLQTIYRIYTSIHTNLISRPFQNGHKKFTNKVIR